MFIISALSPKNIKIKRVLSLWRHLTNEQLGTFNFKSFNMQLPNGLFKEDTPNPSFDTLEHSHGTITKRGWTMLIFQGVNIVNIFSSHSPWLKSTITDHRCYLFSRRSGLHASGAFFFHKGLDQSLEHLSFDPISGGWRQNITKIQNREQRT